MEVGIINMKMSQFKKVRLFRSVLFLVIGIVIFWFIQELICPKYTLSTMSEEMGGKVKEIHHRNTDEYDVVFVGTSHVVCGVSPLEIYQRNQIKSYNFAVSAQPLGLTYCILYDLIENKAPQLVVLDASGLFTDGTNPVPWKYVLDNISMNENKFFIAKKYAQNVGREAILGGMFPFFDYHTRWKSLTLDDFNLKGVDIDKDCLNGYEIRSGLMGASITVEDMNTINAELVTNNVGERIMYGSEPDYITRDIEVDCITENNQETLMAIKQLCEEKEVQLLMIKVPALSDPVGYRTWTIDRYYNTKELCQQLGIDYWDLMYDSNLNVNWDEDTHDGGYHLNIRGAEKVSTKLADNIAATYHINQDKDLVFDEKLVLYRELKEIALLESESNIFNYLEKLQESQHELAIIMAVNNNCQNCFSDLEQQEFNELGFKTNVKDLSEKSYLAIIDGGELCYEVYSNVEEEYYYVDNKGNSFNVISSGHLSSPLASIKVNDEEIALNWVGLNIVVFDKNTNMAIDSLVVNGGMIYRDNNITDDMLSKCRVYYSTL